MNRDAHVRAARRRQALDALAFEQDREAMLVGQLEDMLAEVEGDQLDGDLFAQMSPDDAALVRAALGQDVGIQPDDDDLEFALDFEEDEAETSDTELADIEEEIARLQVELESSRRTQTALTTYLELLSGPSVA